MANIPNILLDAHGVPILEAFRNQTEACLEAHILDTPMGGMFQHQYYHVTQKFYEAVYIRQNQNSNYCVNDKHEEALMATTFWSPSQAICTCW